MAPWRREASVIDLESGMKRRRLLQWLMAAPAVGLVGSLSACQQTPPVYDLEVSRDVGCSCCHAWTEVMQASGRFRVTMTDAPDLPALKQKLGVPAGLGACHTAIVQGYVIEGHVPAQDILRLLAERPAGIRGIAVTECRAGLPEWSSPTAWSMTSRSSRSMQTACRATSAVTPVPYESGALFAGLKVRPRMRIGANAGRYRPALVVKFNGRALCNVTT